MDEKNGLLDRVDFALDEMPGQQLHDVLRAYRKRGPVEKTRFLGIPSFVISENAALGRAFQDETNFPGHRMYANSFEPAIGRSFISMEDGSEHLAYRRLATPAFRSRAVSSYENDGMAALAHEILDSIEEERGVAGDPCGEFDLVEKFTARFPYLVITRLLGLPRDREAEFHQWAIALLSFRDDPARAQTARRALSDFLAPVVEDRRRTPRNDVISELVAAEIDGRRLDDDEIFSHIRLLFPTGGETTHGSLGNLLYALLATEGAWARVAQDLDLVPKAVAEALRWETSIAVLPRFSQSKDCVVEGVAIPADSWVLFAAAGANRDPAVVDDPDVFDIDRIQPPNLTFGRGAKSCPGMHLAKKNMEVATRVLLERMPNLKLVDHAGALPRKTVLRCPAALRVQEN